MPRSDRDANGPPLLPSGSLQAYRTVWMILVGLLVLSGAAIWIFTGSSEGPLACGVLLALALLSEAGARLFTWLEIRRQKRESSVEWQVGQILSRDLQTNRRRAGILSAKFNGWMFVITAPLVTLVSVSRWHRDYGVSGVPMGFLFGAFWLYFGVRAIRWAKKESDR